MAKIKFNVKSENTNKVNNSREKYELIKMKKNKPTWTNTTKKIELIIKILPTKIYQNQVDL